MGRFWLTVLGTLLLDQISKLLVVQLLARKVTIVPGFLVLRYVGNPGAAFGFFANYTLFLAVLITLTLGLATLAGYNKLKAAAVHWQWGAGLLFGGALGNLIDRLRFGHVVDFIDLGFWPVFNIADTAIVLGAVFIALGLLKE